jgi:hypothetical protein
LLKIDGERASTRILGDALAAGAGGSWIYFAGFQADSGEGTKTFSPQRTQSLMGSESVSCSANTECTNRIRRKRSRFPIHNPSKRERISQNWRPIPWNPPTSAGPLRLCGCEQKSQPALENGLSGRPRIFPRDRLPGRMATVCGPSRKDRTGSRYRRNRKPKCSCLFESHRLPGCCQNGPPPNAVGVDLLLLKDEHLNRDMDKCIMQKSDN